MKLNLDSALKKDLCDRINSLMMPGEKKNAFAIRCGVPQTTMSGYLNANRLPKIDHLISIAASCSVTLDWLITGDEFLPAYEGHSADEAFNLRVQEPEDIFELSGKTRDLNSDFIARVNEITGEVGGLNTLSQISGIPQSTIANYYKGVEPTRPQLIALAKAVGKTISWLITGESLKIQPQKQKDSFDQAMDEFFEMVKNWQIDENGRNMKTVIEFAQEFPLRFPEMSEWLKKKKRKGVIDKLSKPGKDID
jgi:transcriptional regulator with XRE-family HTH domain